MTTTIKRRQIPFVDLKSLHHPLNAEILSAITGVIDRADFILGGDVAGFEEEFARYCGVRHGVGVDSGTSALELGLRAAHVGPGDEVITAANTFIATALAITAVGARPVLVDMDPATNNLDPSAAEAAISSKTRAIVPVHLYGHPAPMDEVMKLASAHDLFVLEDASQSHGARYRGRRVGGLGHLAAFSLYPSKNLGALGDAGVVVTDDDRLADSIRLLRNWGSTVKYQHPVIGWNRRLDSLQAAVLRVKLRHLDDWNERRRRIAHRYNVGLSSLRDTVETPAEASWAEHVYHVYAIRSERRDELQEHLRESGIGTVIHYPVPIHLQPAYRDLGYSPGDFPHAELAATEILSLPMFPGLADDDVDQVVEVIGSFR